MLSVLLSLTPLLPQAPAPNDRGGGRELEVFALQQLCSPRIGLVPPPWGSMLRCTPEEDRLDLVGGRDDDPQLPADAVRELLDALHGPAMAGGTMQVDAQTGSMLVWASAPTLAEVRGEMRALGAVLLRPLQIEGALWPLDGSAPPAVLGAREYAQFVAERQPLWRAAASARSGGAAALDQQTWTRYVRDVEVEIAQQQATTVPRTDGFLEGGRVVVRPHALAGDDDIVLHLQFGLAQRRGPVRQQPTGVPQQPDLDLPLLESIFGACSGRVQNGGALAIALHGDAAGGGRFVLTVRAYWPAPAPGSTGGRFGVFPISALTSTSLYRQIGPPQTHPATEDRAHQLYDDRECEPGFGCIEQDRLVELVHTALGPVDDAAMRLAAHGGHLFVAGSADAVARADATLRSLQQRLLRNAVVRHAAMLSPADGAAAAAAGTAETPLHELVVPTLLGREATVGRVLETNAPRDVGAEVAQEAAISRPFVEVLQSGAWLRACVVPVDGGMHLRSLAQVVHVDAPPPRSVAPAGALVLPTQASARAAHDGFVAADKAIEHGAGPTVRLGAREQRSRLSTTVTW